MNRMAGIAALSLLLVSEPAWAARTQVHEAAESQDYGRKFGGMIGRGAINAVTCFVDVLVNLVNETKAGPPLIGTLTGVAKGTGCGVLRLGSGAVDLVTFWVPGFNGFPVSDSYENCLAVTSPALSSTAAMSEPFPPASQPASSVESPAPSEPSAQPSAPMSEPEKPAKRKWTK